MQEETYSVTFFAGKGCVLTWGGDAGDDGAVLAPDDVLLEDTFGVEELPELAVEGVEPLEFDMTDVDWGLEVIILCCTVFVWSVGISGVLSSSVGVGGATREGPGWTLYRNYL